MKRKRVFSNLKIALFFVVFILGLPKFVNAGEFICEFYCDTGESKLLQTKSKHSIKVKVNASTADDAKKYLLGGGWSYSRASKICQEHGYKELYIPTFGSGIHCE